MRPRTIGFLISLLAVVMLAPLAVAQPICFQASPFIDVFTFTISVESAAPLRAALTGTMEAPGLYQLGGAGVLLISAIDPVGAYAMRVPMANLGLFFGGNAVCALVATVAPTPRPWTGTWRLTCTGTPDAFTVPGTMTEITCPLVFPTAEVTRSVEEVFTEMRAHGSVAAGEASSNGGVE